MSDTGECKDCKWWEPVVGLSHVTGWGVCSLSRSEGSQGAVSPNSLAVAFDYEVYSAALHTAPAFGCNQFEPREAPKPVTWQVGMMLPDGIIVAMIEGARDLEIVRPVREKPPTPEQEGEGNKKRAERGIH